eukprot:CAMPEP_0196688222 /NCGR_PEP_ID=MMETSP1090-20130531/15868_1 /TAXON_ID=37098 /ORGANISM="Isochrysis sp, Strain CCMP1244" /LENGTH=118 /DNA_ID=CAMNT_0042027091 /DNA_START=304 /DNA_END=658 /DNA_ORIENTATION=-
MRGDSGKLGGLWRAPTRAASTSRGACSSATRIELREKQREVKQLSRQRGGGAQGGRAAAAAEGQGAQSDTEHQQKLQSSRPPRLEDGAQLLWREAREAGTGAVGWEELQLAMADIRPP